MANVLYKHCKYLTGTFEKYASLDFIYMNVWPQTLREFMEKIDSLLGNLRYGETY